MVLKSGIALVIFLALGIVLAFLLPPRFSEIVRTSMVPGDIVLLAFISLISLLLSFAGFMEISTGDANGTGIGTYTTVSDVGGVYTFEDTVNAVLRGGAFSTPSDQATCFFRKDYSRTDYSVGANVGFRCVKEI